MKRIEFFIWVSLILITALVTIICGMNMLMTPMFYFGGLSIALVIGFIYRINRIY